MSHILNVVYNESPVTMPMKHGWAINIGEIEGAYAWRKNKRWHAMRFLAGNKKLEIGVDLEKAFITEHY